MSRAGSYALVLGQLFGGTEAASSAPAMKANADALKLREAVPCWEKRVVIYREVVASRGDTGVGSVIKN